MKNKNTLASILAILGVLFITIGASYSFFNYSKEGKAKNVIESGYVKFHYQEGDRSITLNDAMPMTDEQGKGQDKYFDFTITGDSNAVHIPYYVTVRKKGEDNSLNSAVKFYLTKVSNKGKNNESEQPVTLETGNQVSKFSELNVYTNDTIGITAAKNERVLYTDEGDTGALDFSRGINYRLRMWVDKDVTYSQTETGSCSDPTYTTRDDCVAAKKDWTDVATSEEKTFTVTVNVYAEGNSAVNSVYAIGDTVTINGTDWYIVENTTASDERIKLMSKLNINPNANASTSATDLFINESDYSNYVLAYDTNGSSNYDSSSVKSFLEGDGKAAIENVIGVRTYGVGIWGEEELTDLGCTVTWDNNHQYVTSLSCDNTKPYYSSIFGAAGSLSTYSWTKLPRSASNILAVTNDGQTQDVSASVATFGGVRPVISVHKSIVDLYWPMSH